MMESILTPVAAAAYRNGHTDWYGAVEIDANSRDEVWRFDSTESEFEVAELYEASSGMVKHRGFRPASVQRLSSGLTLISGWRRGVLVDEDGDVFDYFSHKLMNDVHETQKTKQGTYLVASTGADTIIELDEDYNEIWNWRMWEHVMESSKPAGYYPDKLGDNDIRDLAFTPDERYHLNYATYIGESTILASALNYGVFLIDRDTGNITKQNVFLDECHNPYKLGDMLVVAESGNDRVVVTDWNSDTTTLFERGLSFVKDADPIDDEGNWLVTDTKNNRILVWHEDSPEPHQIFELPEDSKPYESDYLEGGDSFA